MQIELEWFSMYYHMEDAYWPFKKASTRLLGDFFFLNRIYIALGRKMHKSCDASGSRAKDAAGRRSPSAIRIAAIAQVAPMIYHRYCKRKQRSSCCVYILRFHRFYVISTAACTTVHNFRQKYFLIYSSRWYGLFRLAGN